MSSFDQSDQAKETVIGIGYFCIGMVFEAMMDASAKWISNSYSLPQILFFRASFALIPLAILILISKDDSWKIVGNVKLQLLRAVGMGLVFCSYVVSLRYLSLVEVLSLFLTFPFFVVMVSRIFLKEQVSPAAWVSLIIGFLGALLIINPEFNAIGPIILFPMLAALICAFVLVVTKVLTRTVTALSITVWGSIMLMMCSGLLAPFYWSEVAPADILPLVLTGIFGGLAALFITISLRHADLKSIAPFQYTSLIWTTILGIVIWSDYPSYMTWLGVMIIMIAGMMILRLNYGQSTVK